MPNLTLEDELHQHLDRLFATDRQRVLELAQRLALGRPHGVPGRDLLQFAGLIPREDLEEMERAIEMDCERIDPDGW